MTENNNIAFAADHAGFELKNKLIAATGQGGQNKSVAALDFGTDGAVSVDYPDCAHPGGHHAARVGKMECS